ncbi:MAG TPA: glucokinase [Methylomirabilota bacterium]|nr:glucokinase [Methylomirabilota bacterium]
MILAGDVGGTKTTLALFDGERLVREATMASRGFASLEAAIERFLDAAPRPTIAALAVGVAGPVIDGRSTTTNLPWHIDERVLAAAVPVPRVRLVNDLEAAAHGMLALAEEDFLTLQAGRRQTGNLAVIAAGTGLGEALVVADGERHIVIASEGGHADFAPRGDRQEDLLRFLRKEFQRVSYERVLSGPGLHNVYRFLRDTGAAPESAAVADALSRLDPGAVITEHALGGTDALSERTVEMFAEVYGAEAGNLALKGLAVGGVVVAGGIAPRIAPLLARSGFVAHFRDKGRLSPLMESIPVRIALNVRAPVLGAARIARALLTG